MSNIQTRRLVYLEDHQMWFTTPVIFETNCPLTLEQMSEISWAFGHGRISCSFGHFQDLLRKGGFTCVEIERLADRAEPPAGLEQVLGATGNY